MKVSKRDLMRFELIGLEVEVMPNPGCGNIHGLVVDETKNTFLVRKGDREVTVPKSTNEFLFTYQGDKVQIHGSEIQHRPEDRIKKIR
ncbi:MAG: ribonuclease P protein subunit [Methanomassiliicoccus sp.]|nr:ribonuclease P protein subunit [Methanomassiliicoccus sp.]